MSVAASQLTVGKECHNRVAGIRHRCQLQLANWQWAKNIIIVWQVSGIQVSWS
jgi:hypothetical protein